MTTIPESVAKCLQAELHDLSRDAKHWADAVVEKRQRLTAAEAQLDLANRDLSDLAAFMATLDLAP